MLFAERCEAFIIKCAVGQVERSQELPDRTIVPIKYGEDAHETWPARARLCKRLQVLRPRIASPISHYDRLDTLFVDKTTNLTFEVCRVKLDANAVSDIIK